jgi:hypothetical protein
MSGSFQFDNFLYRRDAEIMVECAVSYIPGSVHYLSEYLDCCLWMMAVWDLLAQPHSTMPYVQMCLMTALYIRILFSTDKFYFRPISQFKFVVYFFFLYVFSPT